MEILLVVHRTAIQKLVRSFSSIQFEHVSRAQEKHADAWVTLVSMVDIPDKVVDVRVTKKTLRATVTDLIPVTSIYKQDPRTSIIRIWLKHFTLINGELYFWSNDGVLARPLSKVKAKEELGS